MPRIVRCSIIQASNAVPATEPLAVQKQAMIEKHLGLIRKAASGWRTNCLPSGNLQWTLLLRRTISEMVRQY
jgi:hypothetical protein